MKKYLNWGLFRVMQTLGGHGHFDGYDHLLFDLLKNLRDIKGRITDYAFWSLRINKIETGLSTATFNSSSETIFEISKDILKELIHAVLMHAKLIFAEIIFADFVHICNN